MNFLSREKNNFAESYNERIESNFKVAESGRNNNYNKSRKSV